MLLVALLAVPAVGAALLVRAGGRAAVVVHGLTAYVARQRTPDAVAHKNLGVAYQLLAPSDPDALAQMARHFAIALQIQPGDPDRDAMRALIERSRTAAGERGAPEPR